MWRSGRCDRRGYDLAEAPLRVISGAFACPSVEVCHWVHYPLLEDVFQSALGNDVKVFSQAALADSLKDYLNVILICTEKVTCQSFYNRSPQHVLTVRRSCDDNCI